jgi:putative transposase
MEIIDKQFLETPWYGSRQMARHMERQGHKCGRRHAGSVPLARRVRRLMRLMRLVPIYQEPNTSKKHPAHKIYPYLLKGLAITRPNQVWCADITYIRMERGFLYLVAIMDRHSRRVFDGLTRPHRGHGPISPWRLSNTLEADFCVAALKEALAEYGPPEIFNTDQGAQFTSGDWTCELKAAKVQISMDGKGRWIDNRMIERLWRSLNRRSAKRNTNASTCAPSRPGHRPETVSANGWPITTPRGPTRPTAS